ncbi:hypothetical protein KKJFFJLC_00006 [Vibrio phage vB_VpaS_PGB]|nr:hypothetical protein HHKILHMN_00030 [Vibrio phage vB_VpaS_PGA]WVH05549.1 hypothetical protein KKJFFJLC_00006 [Vibrio phage vB_VpaS_PGB]
MRNFPINLLAAAQSVIGKQEYTIQEWLSRTQNDRGHEVDVYSEPVARQASIQPMEPKEINFSGLDMNQVYIEIFDLDLIKILTRSTNPPIITWNGYIWEPIPQNGDWIEQGGWNRVTCSRKRKVA